MLHHEKKGKQKTVKQNKRLPWRIGGWDMIVKIQGLRGGTGCDRIGPVSNQTVLLLNKLSVNTRLLNMTWLDWSKFCRLWVCVCVCVSAMVWTITITHTAHGGWVWPSSNTRQGSISEKEDQWASQPASYGGLKTFHDLRDARPRSNQLYSVSTRSFASPSVQL